MHESESLDDAMEMFDSHIPLTYRERKLILQSLYDLAFREGARQGRLAGVAAVQNEVRQALSGIDPRRAYPTSFFTGVLRGFLPREPGEEYADPTTAIRRNLEETTRLKIDGRHVN